jgi:hypothetical protein
MPTDSTERFPRYSYVPGGPWPHPVRSPAGHSHGRTGRAWEPATPNLGAGSAGFLRGAELFDAGYYWEAHEVWEGLWHAEGRRGATADALKGLIKLAAAGIKVREGRESGVRTHARRAAECFAAARRHGGANPFGLDLDQWIERARAIAGNPPTDPGPCDAPVTRVFEFRVGDAGDGDNIVSRPEQQVVEHDQKTG